MKKLLIGLAVVAVGIFVWFLSDSAKPQLLAKIEYSREVLYVTNGSELPWPNPTIILNDSFGGPQVVVSSVAAGERRAIPLTQFVGLFNKQRFNPAVQKVTEVIITADGFQLGSYH